jgi:hypothetical protein
MKPNVKGYPNLIDHYLDEQSRNGCEIHLLHSDYILQ